jgi:hypothetical protein
VPDTEHFAQAPVPGTPHRDAFGAADEGAGHLTLLFVRDS